MAAELLDTAGLDVQEKRIILASTQLSSTQVKKALLRRVGISHHEETTKIMEVKPEAIEQALCTRGRGNRATFREKYT